MQRTCCQRAEILVTAGDVERIAVHTGQRDFFERRAPADPSYLDADEDDPNWLSYTVAPDGTRRVLRRQENGDCGFLAATGCTLPLATRPLVCRLYPFAYSESGIAGEDSEYCPTAVLAPRGQPMTEVLGITVAEGRVWHRQLYEELRDGSA
jgi:Fe-S-cluster containining protein